jgi:predicted nucleic acid-binding protein
LKTAKIVRSVTWAYFDTSALVKRYVNEAGRRDVLRLMDRYECVTSAVMPVELRSALRRRADERRLDRASVPEILKRFATDRAYWAFIAVTQDILAAAETLVTVHPLRTLDAIHAASAQLFKARLAAPDLRFVTADVRQTEAAAAVGMTATYVG